MSLFLAGRLHVLDNRGEVWKTALVLMPLIGASLIAATRIMDAQHHGFDVLFSSLLGLLVAWGAYRQYYPPLYISTKKGKAYGIRSWGDMMDGTGNSGLPTTKEHNVGDLAAAHGALQLPPEDGMASPAQIMP
jgi:diacylglycerol diphosphate phosphatase / phosphatidate phosphatase